MNRHKERDPVSEISPDLINALTQTFISRIDCYALQLWKGNYTCIRQPISPQLVNVHLRGLVTLGVYALDAESKARWLCLDADNDDQWDVLKTINQDLATEGITSYLETSRRGGHLWLFTDPIPGRIVRQFGQALSEQYSVMGVEIYPKQDKLTTGPGSQVRLPFGIHRKSGKRYHFITPKGDPLAPTVRKQIALLASPTRVPISYIHHRIEIFAHQRPFDSSPPVPARSHPIVPSAAGETLSERLKSTMTVYDFVSRYIQLDERGKGVCPFHDDHVKSFQIHEGRNFWHCYAGCGGGSLIDFWMKWRESHGQNASFIETIKELREMLL